MKDWFMSGTKLVQSALEKKRQAEMDRINNLRINNDKVKNVAGAVLTKKEKQALKDWLK